MLRGNERHSTIALGDTVTWQDPYGQNVPGPYGPNPYGPGDASPYGPGPSRQEGTNPYGQPTGWQDTRPGWPGPYAAQDPYGQQGYGYYGPPGARPGGSNGATVGALVANIVCAVLFCGTIAWLPGLILAAVAMNRTQTDPASARNLTVWSWVCFAISVVLGVVLLVALLALGAFDTASAGSP